MNPSILSPEIAKVESAVIPRVSKARNEFIRRILLASGILSSLLYIAMCIFIPMQLEGYNSGSQTISELSAIGVSTRPIWVLFGILYTLLVAAFGLGVWQSATSARSLHIAGALLIIYGLIGLGWPLAPMHQRETLAAGGGTISDTMHIVFSMVSVLLMLLIIGFGAVAFGKRFRIYSIATLVILLLFGALTGMDGPNISENLPTPWIGVLERICIGVYMLWVVVSAIVLLKRKEA